MNVRRRTFIFHADWAKAIAKLETDEDRLEAFMCLAEFGLTGERPPYVEGPQVDTILDLAEERIAKDYARFKEYMRRNRDKFLQT